MVGTKIQLFKHGWNNHINPRLFITSTLDYSSYMPDEISWGKEFSSIYFLWEINKHDNGIWGITQTRPAIYLQNLEKKLCKWAHEHTKKPCRLWVSWLLCRLMCPPCNCETCVRSLSLVTSCPPCLRSPLSLYFEASTVPSKTLKKLDTVSALGVCVLQSEGSKNSLGTVWKLFVREGGSERVF